MKRNRRIVTKGPAAGMIVFFLLVGYFSPGAFGSSQSKNLFEGLSSGIIDSSPSIFKVLVERYTADKQSLERFYDFPFSSARISRFRLFCQEWLDVLKGIEFSLLSRDGQIDYILFKNHLTRELLQLDQQEQSVLETQTLLPFARIIIALKEDLNRMRWIQGQAAAKRLSELKAGIGKKLMSIKEQVSEGPVGSEKSVIKSAVLMAGSLQVGLKKWFDFYSGYDPLFTWWATEPYQAAKQALDTYIDFIRVKLLGERPGEFSYPIRKPVGSGVLSRELSFEMIPYTPEEILAIGWQELAWCEKERLKATEELGYGRDWSRAIEHVKNLHVAPGKQPELIRHMAFEAIDFLESHESLTIPPMVKTIIRMEMMPLARQRITPFFTGGEIISVAYPTNSVPHERKIATMRGNNPHFSRAVVHHELVPGHNLQGFMSARYRSYRRPFSTSFFGEGWPLYWEMRLWDMGFQRSAEDRIGMLFWRMHRCARIIFSMSYHLGKMTVDECIDLLVNRIGHDRPSATVETKAHLSGMAYGGKPLAQISYLVGGLQIRALSAELVASGRMSAKSFHDAVLRENSIPIELLRAKLANLQLSPDYQASWKFYTFK